MSLISSFGKKKKKKKMADRLLHAELSLMFKTCTQPLRSIIANRVQKV